MDTGLVVAVIGVLSAPMAVFLTWALGRRKQVAEIYSVMAESSQTAVETMQTLMEELRIELIEAKDKIDELIKENELLRIDLQELKVQNEQLITENRAFKRKIEDLSKSIKNMGQCDVAPAIWCGQRGNQHTRFRTYQFLLKQLTKHNHYE